MREDPIHRKYHHDQLTFSIWYAFTENFVLPLSHDEVVHGKGSLIGKMPGDRWQQFANLRLLYGYMWAHPGKKLLFMGGEFGQRREWQHEDELDWGVLDNPEHAGMQRWIVGPERAPTRGARAVRARFRPAGLRVGRRCDSARHECRRLPAQWRVPAAPVLVVCNFTPVPRENYLRRRAAVRRLLARAAQQRRASLRRQRHRQPGRCRSAAGPGARPLHSLTLTLPPLARGPASR